MIKKIIGLAAGSVLAAITVKRARDFNEQKIIERKEKHEYKELLKKGIIDMDLHKKFHKKTRTNKA